MNAVTARAVGFLDHVEEVFMGVALAFMTILTFVQVVLRYGFGTGWVWSLEATTYAFAWMVLIGMSYGVRTRAHIGVDIAINQLSPALRRIVVLAAIGLCIVYCGFMVYGGAVFIDRLMTLGNNARDIPAPRWLLSVILPIAFVLLAFRFLQVVRQIVDPADATEGLVQRPTAPALHDKSEYKSE
jgi:C4-dicarboxylate transporter DctQ subunit